MSLYVNEDFIDRKIGLFGQYKLEGENIILKMSYKGFKSEHLLNYKGVQLEL